MKFVSHAYKNADIILGNEKHKADLDDIISVIQSISDDDLKAKHQSRKNRGIKSSLAPTINSLIKERLVAKGWKAESPIFQGEEYGESSGDKVWRLDFARNSASVEVAFNHGEAIAWNLLKPTLASEVNNVKKAINTEVGIVITATRELKNAGAFDRAVGEYEKVLKYLVPMSTLLSVPVLVIGLKAPESFSLKPKYPKCADWGTIVSR